MGDIESKAGERATIQAVASRAGVSPTTVSLVLAGKGDRRRISALTHHKVFRAAEELNYAPNLGTRSLRGEQTNILSFFSTYRNRDRKDLYMNTLSSAIEAAGGSMGYDTLVHCNFDRTPKETYQFLNGGLADGLLLFAPRNDDPLLQLLRNCQLPVVILSADDPEGQYSSVRDDLVQGMAMISQAIIEGGHRHVAALIADDPNSRDSPRRIHHLRVNLQAAGLHGPADLAIPCGEHNVDAALDIILAQSPRPTVVFCWHDRLAYAFTAACQARGIEVPGDLSVIGYDGLHWPSRTSHVITSAQVNFDALSLAAVRLLDQAIKVPRRPVEAIVLPVSYQPGSTFGPPDPATEQSHETSIHAY